LLSAPSDDDSVEPEGTKQHQQQEFNYDIDSKWSARNISIQCRIDGCQITLPRLLNSDNESDDSLCITLNVGSAVATNRPDATHMAQDSTQYQAFINNDFTVRPSTHSMSTHSSSQTHAFDPAHVPAWGPNALHLQPQLSAADYCSRSVSSFFGYFLRSSQSPNN
jgi:hypothetical protein